MASICVARARRDSPPRTDEQPGWRDDPRFVRSEHTGWHFPAETEDEWLTEDRPEETSRAAESTENDLIRFD